jgi:hypothetical protein
MEGIKTKLKRISAFVRVDKHKKLEKTGKKPSVASTPAAKI